MVSNIEKRLDKLRHLLKEQQLDAILISKAENIYYLSGFTGGEDGRLLVNNRQAYILTDSRYFEQVQTECAGWTLVEERPGTLSALSSLCEAVGRFGFEAHHLSYQQFRSLDESLSSELIPVDNLVEGLRAIKDPLEIECLRQASRVNDEVFQEILASLKPGLSEEAIARKICFLLREKGCTKESFDTIVLAGENCALPHGRPGPRILKDGDMLTLDFGGFYRHYSGDMTRTVAIGQASSRLHEMYSLVLLAQESALNQVKAGATARQVDRAAREVFRQAGMEKYFIHSTGHGLGLEVHENPSLSQRSEAALSENMVVTVEPGLYIPGWGGIRIEDVVLVKHHGCEIITRSEKGLLIV